MWGRDKYSILMQPSLFIIVLFYFTHLSYPSHLPLSLYKRSCILHTKITKEKKRKKESYSYSLIVQSKPQIGSFFCIFQHFPLVSHHLLSLQLFSIIFTYIHNALHKVSSSFNHFPSRYILHIISVHSAHI